MGDSPFHETRHSLMPSMVRNTAFVLVLIHMVGGCCLHHAHADCTIGSHGLLATDSGCEHAALDIRCQDDCGEHSGHDQHPQCDEGACDFIHDRLLGDDIPLAVATLEVLSAEELRRPLPAVAWKGVEPFMPHGVPPVLLHILKQAFLL